MNRDFSRPIDNIPSYNSRMDPPSLSTICRCLFVDCKPSSLPREVSLDELLKEDQIRFHSKWDFDVNEPSGSNNWQILTNPKAPFYIQPVRNVKMKNSTNHLSSFQLERVGSLDLSLPLKASLKANIGRTLFESPLIKFDAEEMSLHSQVSDGLLGYGSE